MGQEKEKGEEETEEEDNDDYDGEEKEFLAYKYIVNVLLQNLFDKARWVRPLVKCSTVFSCDSSSISRNVGRSVCLPATSFIEVLCCCQCLNVVTVVVVYDIRAF